jgi:hypothetical protein
LKGPSIMAALFYCVSFLRFAQEPALNIVEGTSLRRSRRISVITTPTKIPPVWLMSPKSYLL